MGIGIVVSDTPRSALRESLSFTRQMHGIGLAQVTIPKINHAGIDQGERHAGESIMIYDSWGIAVYGGIIDDVEETRLGGPGSDNAIYQCSCSSWEKKLSKRRCGKQIYSTENAGARFLDLLQRANLDGEDIFIDMGDLQIEDGATGEALGTRSYFGRTIAEVADELAEASGFNWFLTPGRIPVFKPKNNATLSTLIFSDANNNFHEPAISESMVDYANRVHLAIAFEAFEASLVEFAGDGSAKEFSIVVSGADVPVDHVVSIEMAGVTQTFSPKGQNTDAQWTFDFGSNKITQHPDDPAPQAGAQIRVKYYAVGANVITVESADDIAARQLIEDAPYAGSSGIQEEYFEDLSITKQDVGTERANALLRSRNPHLNGAPAGTVPRSYRISARGFIPNANELQPGYVVQVNIDNPNTEGPRALLIKQVSANMVGMNDPSDGGAPGSWLQYTLTLNEYTEQISAAQFYQSLAGKALTLGGGLGTFGVSNPNEPVLPEDAQPAPGNHTDLVGGYHWTDKQDGRGPRLVLTADGTPPADTSNLGGVVLYWETYQSPAAPVFNLSGMNLEGGVSLGGDWKPKYGSKFWYPYDGPWWIDDLDPVARTTKFLVYIPSFSKGDKENVLARAPGDLVGPVLTPFVVITVEPYTEVQGMGEEYGPTVFNFALTDRTPGTNPYYTFSEAGDQFFGAEVGWENKVSDPRYANIKHYSLRIIHPDGTIEAIGSVGKTGVRGSVDDIRVPEIEGALYSLILITVTEHGENSYVKGLTPEVQFTVQRQEGPPGTRFTRIQTGFGASEIKWGVDGDGKRVPYVDFFWQNSEDIRFGGSELHVVHEDDSEEWLPVGKTANYRLVFESFPQYPDVWAKRVELFAVNTSNRRNEYAEGVTPVILFDLPSPPRGPAGAEFVPPPLAFDLTNQRYPERSADGQLLRCLIDVLLTPAEDYALEGYEIWGTNLATGQSKQFTGPERSNITLDFNIVPDSQETWRFFPVGVDRAGNKNSMGAFFEDYTLDPPELGDNGVEHTGLINIQSVVIQTRTTGEGLEQWRYSVQWQPPSDTNFGGPKFVLWRTAGGPAGQFDFEYAGPTDLIFNSKWMAIVPADTYRLYGVSIDVNNNENEIVDGVTPVFNGLNPQLNPIPQFDGSRVKEGTITNAAAASGIVWPQTVSSLPPFADYPLGKQVFLTTDAKIYRRTASGWSTLLDGADIPDRTLAASKMIALSITANELAANSAVFGKVAAGAIGAEQMAAVEFQLRNDGTRPPRFTVELSGSLHTFIGHHPTYFSGIFSKRFKAGASPVATSNYIDVDGSTIVLNGATLFLDKNGLEVTIDSHFIDGVYGFAGVMVKNKATSHFGIFTPNAFALYTGGLVPRVFMSTTSTGGGIRIFGSGIGAQDITIAADSTSANITLVNGGSSIDIRPTGIWKNGVQVI